MSFVDNCTDFITAVLSTATCSVYTSRACFCAKWFMAGLHTRFHSVESSDCISSGLKQSYSRGVFDDSSVGMADGYGGRRIPQSKGPHALALGSEGQSESLCALRNSPPCLAI